MKTIEDIFLTVRADEEAIPSLRRRNINRYLKVLNQIPDEYAKLEEINKKDLIYLLSSEAWLLDEVKDQGLLDNIIPCDID